MIPAVLKIHSLTFNVPTRIVITVIFLIAALIATAAGALFFTTSVSEAQRFQREIQDEFERLNDARLIFGNNLFHTLVMFVPILGPIWGFFVLFNTGTIIATLGIAEGIPPIFVFFLLFFTPVFWLEFGSYSIAMAESVVLLLQMLRRRGMREILRTCVLVTVCTVILAFSAIVEWVMINLL